MSNPVVDVLLKRQREKNNKKNRERPVREKAFAEAAAFLQAKAEAHHADDVPYEDVLAWAHQIERLA